MNKATILAGISDTALRLIDDWAARGQPTLWLGGAGNAHSSRSVGDPRDERAWDDAVAIANSEFGGVARVVNVLENPLPDAGLGELSLSDFDGAMLSTTGRTFAALRATVPAMRDGGGGSFLTIWEEYVPAEADGLVAPTFIGGLEMLTRAIALEYATPPSVRINLLRYRSWETDAAGLSFWCDYLLGDDSGYVTGAHVGGRAHP